MSATLDSPPSVCRSAKFEVYAVGETIRKAITALACGNHLGEVTSIELEPREPDAPPVCWCVRFTADNGTRFKASGEEVSGGVIVTWWK